MKPKILSLFIGAIFTCYAVNSSAQIFYTNAGTNSSGSSEFGNYLIDTTGSKDPDDFYNSLLSGSTESSKCASGLNNHFLYLIDTALHRTPIGRYLITTGNIILSNNAANDSLRFGTGVFTWYW